MKMTWLHKIFGLFFIPANGRAKSAQQLISMVLPFDSLHFPYMHLISNALPEIQILIGFQWELLKISSNQSMLAKYFNIWENYFG